MINLVKKYYWLMHNMLFCEVGFLFIYIYNFSLSFYNVDFNLSLMIYLKFFFMIFIENFSST